MAEAGQHPGQVQTVQAGHLDVREDDVDLVGLQQPQGLGPTTSCQHHADPLVATQQERQLGQRRRFVVHDEC